jgi:hypothetical protein
VFIDTIRTRDSEIVVIALETEHEQRYSGATLAGIALSQDRLQWSEPDAIDPSFGKGHDPLHGWPLVTLPDGCKLRAAPADQSVKVLRVGDATALVMIRNPE